MKMRKDEIVLSSTPVISILNHSSSRSLIGLLIKISLTKQPTKMTSNLKLCYIRNEALVAIRLQILCNILLHPENLEKGESSSTTKLEIVPTDQKSFRSISLMSFKGMGLEKLSTLGDFWIKLASNKFKINWFASST